jgi:hypothetical protein
LRIRNTFFFFQFQEDQTFCFCCLLTDPPDSGDQLLTMENETFTSNNKSLSFLNAYFDVNNFSRNDMPSIPTSEIKMCSLCAAQLESAFIFREMCREATTRLLLNYPKRQISQSLNGQNHVENTYNDDSSFPENQSPVSNKVEKIKEVGKTVENIPQKNNNTNHQCTSCLKHFETDRALTDHKLTHLTLIGKPRKIPNSVYGCQECPKVCHSMVALSLHQRDYHANKPTKCTTCSKVYPNRKTLDIHNRAVHKKNPYVCKICKKSFNHPVARLLHNNTVHLKIKPKCKKCQRKFKSTQSLAIHIRKEHSSVQFTCDICSAEFKFRSAIEGHMESMHLNKCD